MSPKRPAGASGASPSADKAKAETPQVAGPPARIYDLKPVIKPAQAPAMNHGPGAERRASAARPGPYSSKEKQRH
jgi:hypothetical protein